MTVITDQETHLLNSLSLGMFGFGAQGSAEYQNLQKSGVNCRLALRQAGKSAEKAKALGIQSENFETIASQTTHLFMNLPDHVQAKVYQEVLATQPNLRYLIFAHGFASHYELISCVDDGPIHVLIAPKGAASGLTQLYNTPKALPVILAVRDHNGDRPPTDEERTWIEALAKALGANPNRLIWARFKDETVCDLFAEQALLCGGVSSLLRKSFEVLTEAGYQADAAYYETLYELKLIVDLIWEHGISGMRDRISPTARYGDVTRGDLIINEETKSRMKEVLNQVESGEFAREFLAKNQSPDYLEKIQAQRDHPIEKTHRELTRRLNKETDKS